MSEITSMLASFWSMFAELRVPLLGISFATLWIGVFAVSISMRILMPLIGIGGSIPRPKIKPRKKTRSSAGTAPNQNKSSGGKGNAKHN